MCVFGLQETAPAASETGGRGEETWDGLVMKQPFMPQRTKPTLLTRLLPSFTKILTVSTSVCVCVCCSPTLLRLCVTVLTHSYCSPFHIHTHTHSHRRFPPDVHAYSRDSLAGAQSDDYMSQLCKCREENSTSKWWSLGFLHNASVFCIYT